MVSNARTSPTAFVTCAGVIRIGLRTRNFGDRVCWRWVRLLAPLTHSLTHSLTPLLRPSSSAMYAGVLEALEKNPNLMKVGGEGGDSENELRVRAGV